MCYLIRILKVLMQNNKFDHCKLLVWYLDELGAVKSWEWRVTPSEGHQRTCLSLVTAVGVFTEWCILLHFQSIATPSYWWFKHSVWWFNHIWRTDFSNWLTKTPCVCDKGGVYNFPPIYLNFADKYCEINDSYKLKNKFDSRCLWFFLVGSLYFFLKVFVLVLSYFPLTEASHDMELAYRQCAALSGSLQRLYCLELV